LNPHTPSRRRTKRSVSTAGNYRRNHRSPEKYREHPITNRSGDNTIPLQHPQKFLSSLKQYVCVQQLKNRVGRIVAEYMVTPGDRHEGKLE
jgi:hypothetical protein